MLRALLFVGVLGFAGLAAPSGPARAQGAVAGLPLTDPRSLPSVAQPGTVDPAIEHLRHEDSATRIDELRVGGESQTIVVQPKLPLPPYQVLRAGSARGNALNETDASGRLRVWNILNF